MYEQAITNNGELLKKLSSIKLNDASSILGSTSNQATLNELLRAVAELGDSLKSARPYEDIMAKYEQVAAGVDTAGITGLISESEIQDYYKIVDDIWSAVEKERKS